MEEREGMEDLKIEEPQGTSPAARTDNHEAAAKKAAAVAVDLDETIQAKNMKKQPENLWRGVGGIS